MTNPKGTFRFWARGSKEIASYNTFLSSVVILKLASLAYVHVYVHLTNNANEEKKHTGMVF